MSKHIKVLVVDPDQAFRESVVNFLLTCGVEEFEMASSKEEAMEKIAKTVFDIVLVDLFMPQMSGISFAQIFRKQMPRSKIILLVEERQLPTLKSLGQSKLNFPAMLKSFVGRNLPLLLSEESKLGNGNANGSLKNGSKTNLDWGQVDC